MGHPQYKRKYGSLLQSQSNDFRVVLGLEAFLCKKKNQYFFSCKQDVPKKRMS
jgi:hypothetical protein